MRIISYITVAIFMFLVGCANYTPPPIAIPHSEPSTQYLKKLHPRVVLVLSCGSARGFSHAGVLKVLEKNHIPIDLIVGTSAGSIVGALYADNPSATDLEHLLLTTKRDSVIDFSLNLMSGPISGVNLQKFLLQNLRAREFQQLKIPFIAVATDLESGAMHTFASGPIAPAVNASSAAPPFFRPVMMYGRTYIDGGIVDPVAVDVARRFHPDIIIAVKLDFPLAEAMPRNSAGVFLRSFDMMFLKLYSFSANQADVVITPKTGQIYMFQSEGRGKLIKAGEEAALKALPTIKRLLEEKHISYP